jgi:hypothetical protein
MGLNFWASLGYSNTLLHNFSSLSGTLTQTINATGGASGGPSLRQVTNPSGNSDSRAMAALVVPGPTQYSAQRYKTSGLPNGILAPSCDRIILELRESGTAQVDVRITPLGKLKVTSGGVVLGISTRQVVFAGVHFQYEIKAVIHPSAGTIDVRTCGDPAGIPGLTGLTGLNTRVTGVSSIDEVAWCSDTLIAGGDGASVNIDHSDISVRDDGWMGDAQWDYFASSVAGFYQQFTPSAGTNPSTIDETGAPTADHNKTSNVGDIDSFTGGSVSATAVIPAVCQVMLHNKQAAGVAEDKFLFRQGGVDYTGAAFNPPFGSDAYVKEAYLLNPITGLPFTPTEINGTLERGYKRTG